MNLKSNSKKRMIQIAAIQYERIKTIGKNMIPFLKMWGLYVILFIIIQLILSELFGISFNYKLVILCSLLVSYLDYLKER